jgi:hypothetical protein
MSKTSSPAAIPLLMVSDPEYRVILVSPEDGGFTRYAIPSAYVDRLGPMMSVLIFFAAVIVAAPSAPSPSCAPMVKLVSILPAVVPALFKKKILAFPSEPLFVPPA